MEDYLSYELSLYPPALFKDGLMRKDRKGTLGELLLKGIEPQSMIPSVSSFIIDGGYCFINLYGLMTLPISKYPKVM